MLKISRKKVVGLFVGLFVGGSILMAAPIVQPWILQQVNGIPGQLGQDGSGIVTVSGAGFFSNAPVGFPSISTTTLSTLTPPTTGYVVLANPSTTVALCISSGTGVGAWVYLSTPTAICK